MTSQNELVALREAFVTTLAHDLRNPIAALIGYAELVGETGDLNDDQRYFVNRLNQTAIKLHDLAAELIDLSWIEAGLPISAVTLSLRTAIEDVIAELTAAARDKRISIAVSIQDPLPLVIGDPDRLRLVISKLLDNAIRLQRGRAGASSSTPGATGKTSTARSPTRGSAFRPTNST